MYLTVTSRDRRLLLASLKLLTLNLHQLPREVSEMLPDGEIGQLSVIGLVGKLAALREVTMSEQEVGNVLDQDREELDLVTCSVAAATFDGTVQAHGLAETLTMSDKHVDIPLRTGVEPGDYAGYPFNAPLHGEEGPTRIRVEDPIHKAHDAMVVADPDLIATGKALLNVLREATATENDIAVAVSQFERALEHVTKPYNPDERATVPVGWDVADTSVTHPRTTSELFTDLIASMKRDGVVFENEPPAKYLANFLAHALDESTGNGYICHADVDTLARAFESIGEVLNID